MPERTSPRLVLCGDEAGAGFERREVFPCGGAAGRAGSGHRNAFVPGA
ncbi:hypothetical protein HMPREF1317_1576 [Schaalia georgiae F0490]|uniref:Uncharacterized protein n=1 Tax=Schaalia georgiae F0490 TaxID=1125717 RepID=J0NR46_9ACTO|nr:hypothetical protein HMPREF1317_1576 [Schaalia georgiae F0490]